MADRPWEKISKFGAGVAAAITVTRIGMKLLFPCRATEEDHSPIPDSPGHQPSADTYVKRTWLVLGFAMLLTAASVLVLVVGFLGMAFSTLGIDTNLNGGKFHASFPVSAALLASLLWAASTSFSGMSTE